ncbi:MAG TPA: LysR family transcriptional regulator [Chloroflexota bacterium]|nr:LysR family transcriptional regulator [Chloroflexota bacterium]
MEVDQLESFVRVAERGSLTLAARELGITQPGLSRQMQKLERLVGVPLFTRTRNGVRLTSAGERYRAYADEVLTRHRQLLAELRASEATLAGELRIAASTTPGEFLVPRLVGDFTAQHPEVRAIVFSADSRGVVDEVLARRWDCGFVGARLDRKGLRYEPLIEDEVVLAVPAFHPFARQASVELADLAGQSFVEREDGSGTILSVRTALAERGLSLPPYRVSMTLSTTQAIVSAVAEGYGIGFVSSLALADRAAGRVAAVRLAELPLRRLLYLVREEQRVLPPVARRFIDFALAQSPLAASPS